MSALFLFSLIVGGGLLLFSVFASDADGAHDVDGQHAGGDVDGDTLAHEFFSIRALTYFLAGFGATGLALQALTGASATAALLWATVTGLVAASAAVTVYGWLRRSESGVVPLANDHLVGLAARVILPVQKNHRGKVVALCDGREIELLARLYGSDDPDCPRGSTVVIVDVEGDTALVTPVSFLPTESSQESPWNTR